ncbi:MAG TPA: enoyl-CoA hydratase-related protein, partial [Nitrospiraceae bacterium]|nr:enoyl-CoA hydratase-related protein [Nitrospiraceae bacterium]
LNRPERRNAFDECLATELCDSFEELGQDPSTRVMILAGAGPVFCAGADLRWMNPALPVSEAQAREDAHRLVRMYRAIDECLPPVIGRVHGPAFGGGVGLMAVCDIVVAAEDASFALSEARLGLIPAIISPFLLRKAGESFLRRYCLTSEAFSAPEAKHFNLVHDTTSPDGLDKRVQELCDMILRLAPQATRQTKSLLRHMHFQTEGHHSVMCMDANVQARLSEEAKEGLRAFMEKRPPAWTREASSLHAESSNATDQ